MPNSLSTLQCLQPLLAPARAPPALGTIVRLTFGQFSGRVACIVADSRSAECPYLVKLAPSDSSTHSPDANAALVLPATAAAAPDTTHCRLDMGMFTVVRGAVTVGHSVEVQQLLDHEAADKLLRVGCSVRLKGSLRTGIVTKLSPRGATVQLRPFAGDQPHAPVAGNCEVIDAPVDQIIVRLKGTVAGISTRTQPAVATATAPLPLPSYEVHVTTELGDFRVDPFYVSVVLKQRQIQAFEALVAQSAHSNSLQQLCARGDAALLQVKLSRISFSWPCFTRTAGCTDLLQKPQPRRFFAPDHRARVQRQRAVHSSAAAIGLRSSQVLHN